MRRLLTGLLAAVLLPITGPAAPVPKHLMKNRPAYYFPTTVGAKWEYESGTVVVVSKVEEGKGAKVVTVTYDGQKGAPFEVVEVSAAGLVRTVSGGGKLDPPLVMLKGPVKVGDSWAMSTAGLEGAKTIGAVETIKVPAGTFEAVRVDSDYTFVGRRRLNSAWYAPGVGLLKMTEDGNTIWLLKSFTPGKE